MMRKKLLLQLILLAMASGPLFPFTRLTGGSGTPAAPAVVMYAEHDANEVRLGLMSGGQIATHQPPPPLSVGIWPKDTENNYVFGSGIWIAGRADLDGNGDDDYLGLEMYHPNEGISECAPGRIGDDPDSPLSRLFLSTNPQDLLEWPDAFRDEDGDPLVYSLQDIVGFYNDLSGDPIFETGPYGIQVAQRSMAFWVRRTSRVIIFEWEMVNLSDSVPGGPFTIENAWIGVDSDMDIGEEFMDDRTSLFTRWILPEGDTIPVHMAFAWDEDFEESNFTGIPGFVGVKFLRSPGNDADDIDNDGDGLVDESPSNGVDDDGDGMVDEDDEVDEMGLVNYTWHEFPQLSGYPDPRSDEDLYSMMACDPPNRCAEVTEADDVRFMMSSGPFEWLPGMTVKVAAAYVFAPPVGEPDHLDLVGDPPRPDPNDPVLAEFLATALETQAFFDAGYPDSVVGVGDGERGGAIPRAFTLHQNYPNPFNPQTTITFDIPGGEARVPVRLSIYDLRGRLVRRLLEGELAPGRHAFVWDGRDDSGREAGSGAYLLTLRAGDFTSRRKLVLLR
jgi:hypothetical protein